MALSIKQKRASFRTLHERGCFVLPNPWDPGSAVYLQQMGFKALATTSSGHAWSRARADGAQALGELLEHFRTLVAATDLPINADFLDGLGKTPEEVGINVGKVVETGVAGLSIEDSTHDPDEPLRPIDEAVERVRAARRAIDESGGDTILVGRAENFIAGHPDLDDTIRRLGAYSEAGADCLYAPGIRTREQIEAVVTALAPKPINVLIGGDSQWTLEQLESLGVRRVSVGGGLARVAWGAIRRTVGALAAGRFDGFGADAMDYGRLNAMFRPGE